MKTERDLMSVAAKHPVVANAVKENKNVLVFFFSKSNTPRCTIQNQDFGAHYHLFNDHNTEVIGISRDPEPVLNEFQQQLRLPFELAADPNCDLAREFGVLQTKQLGESTIKKVKRSTFLLAPCGKLLHCWPEVNVKGHAKQVLDVLQNMQLATA